MKASLSAALDSLGARIKLVDDPGVPYDDYYTTPEFSFVRLEMPARRWREGVALLAELVRFPRLEREEVEAVRKEILDIQKRRQDSSRSRALELMDRTLAPGHPLSRPVLGSASSVSGITQNDLRAFHKTYVTGKRMILTGVSPEDPSELLAALRAAFGGIPAGSDPAASRPAPLTPRNQTARAQGQSKQSTIALSYLFDAPPSELPALAVAGAILSDKLTFDLREQKGLAYSMGASIQPWAGRVRLQVVMGTRRENVDKALAALREGITGLPQPTDAEVRKAAAALRGRGGSAVRLPGMGPGVEPDPRQGSRRARRGGSGDGLPILPAESRNRPAGGEVPAGVAVPDGPRPGVWRPSDRHRAGRRVDPYEASACQEVKRSHGRGMGWPPHPSKRLRPVKASLSRTC